MRSAILREISAKALNTKEAHVASKNGLTPKKKQKDVTADDVPVVVVNEEVVVTPDVSLSASSFVEESISIPEDQIVVGLIDRVDQSPQPIEEVVPPIEKKKNFFKKKTQTTFGS